MARVELPVSRLRARKRRRRLLVVLVVCMAIAVLVGGALAALHAPFVRIADVTISGTKTVATTTVRERVEQELQGSYIGAMPRNSIFLYPKRSIVAVLEREFPVFKAVDVHAVDFDTLGVVVAEREAAALWCTSTEMNQCMYMDEDGVVYAPAPQGSEEAYVPYSGGAADGQPRQYLTPDKFRALSAFVGALGALQHGSAVHTVGVDAEEDVRVRFKNGFELFFTLHDAAGDVFERFALARKTEPFTTHGLEQFEYLDLRFGDKLYYKLRDE